MTYRGDNVAQTAAGFVGRFQFDGRWTWRKLASITLRSAKEERAKLQADHERAAIGLAEDPFKRRQTVADIVDTYLRVGCPDRYRRARTKLGEVPTQLARVKECLGAIRAEELTAADCNRYHDWRVTRVRRGDGHRTVEIELAQLSGALRWAAGSGLIVGNPLAQGRPTYTAAGDVRHCTATMPASDDELHAIATFLISDPYSESAGWQLLLEALTGCRTSEVLALRWDASPGRPGQVTEQFLFVDRAKKGEHASSLFPYVLLDQSPGVSPLRDLLQAMRRWHDQRFPSSPWFLPGRSIEAPSDPGRLTHALKRATAALGLPHRTSHGLRAFYVRTARSLGLPDHEIAMRLGHRSGVQLIERTYGVPEPGWFGQRKQDWRPETVPCAWAKWLEAGNVIDLNTAIAAGE
jgi:integrase